MPKRSPLHLGPAAAVRRSTDGTAPGPDPAPQTDPPAPLDRKPSRRTRDSSAHTPAARPPSRQGKRSIAGFFSDSTWVAFRQLGLQQRKSNQELLQEAIDDLFAKYRAR